MVDLITTPLLKPVWEQQYAPGWQKDPTLPESSRMCELCRAHAKHAKLPWPPCGKKDPAGNITAELNQEYKFSALDQAGMLATMTTEQRLDIQLQSDPVLWSTLEFQFDGEPWMPFWYQEMFMRCTAVKRAAVWGRRAGKSECIIALMLWYAFYRVGEPGHDREYHIQVFVNSENLAKKHWEETMKFLAASRSMSGMVENREKGKRIELSNNVTIYFNVLSKKQLGQDAHFMWFDEAAFYEDEDAFVHATAIKLSRPNTPMILTSNSSGFRGKFYEFATASDTYLLQLPSYVNKNWNLEQELFCRQNYSSHEYDILIKAEWGSSSTGVFNPTDLEYCLNHFSYRWADCSVVKGPAKFRALGVDWNEAVNGVHMVVTEFDPNYKPEGRPFIRVIHKRIVKGKEFNHEIAIQTAIDTMLRWDCNVAFLDRGGGGSLSSEHMRLRLIQQGQPALAQNVVTVDMAETFEIPDYHGNMVRKRAKNLLVNVSQILCQNHQLGFPWEERDDDGQETKNSNIIPQARAFKVAKTQANGMAVYECDLEDHTLTAWMLAVYAITVNKTDIVAFQVPVPAPETLPRQALPSESVAKQSKREDDPYRLPNEGPPARAYMPGWRVEGPSRTAGWGENRKRTW